MCAACLFLTLFLAASPAGAAGDTENGDGNGHARYVSIDFNDVDIHVFIKFISELTGRNFIVDRRVKGKVTIISPSQISVEEAYRVFESVLEVHGFTTVDSGDVIKIVTSPEARTKSVETLMKNERRSPDDRVVTQIIPLRYADPNEVRRIFAPLVSKSAALLAYTPTNTLILTDIYSNIRRLMEIVKAIDVEGVGQEISVIPLDNADATKTVRLLTTVFQAKKQASGKKGVAANQETAKFVADERTNSVVAVASETLSVRIRTLVNRLDRELPRGRESIHVYYLEHATAEELAKTLQSLSQKKSTSKENKGKAMSPIVSSDVKITADKPTNSLIIMAEKDEYEIIEEIIQKLDIPRAMVYIECLIMEVNVDKGFGLGMEWIAGGKTQYGSNKDAWIGGGWAGQNGFSNLGSVAAAAATGGAMILPDGFSLGVFGETISIGGVKFQNLGAIAQAYRQDKDTHILSMPQLLTTDNEEAVINVGQNVPYQTKQGTTSASETYNTYEYKDVGITLTVTPQISKDRLIRLKIEQVINKIDQAANQTASERPTTLKREVKTTVIVQDKNTIVIGGLIDDQLSESQNKIPCLGDIPGLGWAFKSMNRGRQKTNLFIFLTPHVVRTPGEAKELYEIKRTESEYGNEDTGIKLYPPEKRRDIRIPTVEDVFSTP
ncbi:MAG: type II secretion system protein GspD [Desulfobacterales bacterium]|nr:MAG: type II secretion system protein GspD [Desulfobacterales bacterium]